MSRGRCDCGLRLFSLSREGAPDDVGLDYDTEGGVTQRWVSELSRRLNIHAGTMDIY